MVTIDPDAFSDGTDITGAFASLGVTLSAVGGGFSASGLVFAVDPTDSQFSFAGNFLPSTGSLVFGHDGRIGTSSTDTVGAPFGNVWVDAVRNPGTGLDETIQLRIDFAGATDYVAIDYISNDSADEGVLHAFSSTDVLLASYHTAILEADEFETMFISRTTRDIAYVIASGGARQTGGLDHLRFNMVPLPSSAALAVPLLIGLAVKRGGRRRRHVAMR